MAFGESIRLCRLYEKTSKNGNVYLSGRLAGAKVAVLKSKDVSDSGEAMWDIVLSQAPDRNVTQSNVVVGEKITSSNGHHPGGSFDKELDDTIPF